MKSNNKAIFISAALTFGGIFIYNIIQKRKSKVQESENDLVKKHDFKDFVLEKRLWHNNFLGYFKDNYDEKLIFEFKFDDFTNPEETIKSVQLKTKFTDNGIYRSYQACVPMEKFMFQVHTIYPAPLFQIKKREKQLIYRFVETEKAYTEFTLPYINAIPTENNRWIQEIFKGTKEGERVLHINQDNKSGYVFTPDEYYVKDKTSLENLHLIAIAKDASIRTLRDLTEEHLPMLKNLRLECYKILQEVFDLPRNRVIAYVSYLPTFFQFHVHFVPVETNRSLRGVHVLEEIIENLESQTQHYRVCKLTLYLMKERHKRLCEDFNTLSMIEEE